MRILTVLLVVLLLAGLTGTALSAPDDAPDVVALKEKLAAVEKAYAAGILTKEEYEKKKAEIEAKLRAAAAPALDEETRQKLEALQKAYEADPEFEEAKHKMDIYRPLAMSS